MLRSVEDIDLLVLPSQLLPICDFPRVNLSQLFTSDVLNLNFIMRGKHNSIQCQVEVLQSVRLFVLGDAS